MSYRLKYLSSRNYIITVLAGLILVSSCAPTKRSAYLRDADEVEGINDPDRLIQQSVDSLYIIKGGDELYITVSSSDDEPNNFSSSQVGFTNIDMLSYLVDKDGFVKLPYVGKINVSGMTLDSASATVEADLGQYIYQPVVSMKLVNARVTVLGEVNDPGVFVVNNKPLNIYQALGYAGDITEYGNRENILIVREGNEVITKKYLDLTNDEILTSEWYILQPNDIVYVEPLGRRKWGMETFPWDLIASAISTTILIMTFMITLTS